MPKKPSGGMYLAEFSASILYRDCTSRLTSAVDAIGRGSVKSKKRSRIIRACSAIDDRKTERRQL